MLKTVTSTWKSKVRRSGIQPGAGEELGSNMQSMQMFVDGRWVDSTNGERLVSIDPATREPLVDVPCGTAEDIDQAVKAARAAFESSEWSEMVPAQRGRFLNRLAESIRENADEL